MLQLDRRVTLNAMVIVLTEVPVTERAETVLTYAMDVQGYPRRLVMCLDTAAAINLITQKTLDQVLTPSKLQKMVQPSHVTFSGVAGQKAESRGRVVLPLQLTPDTVEDTTFEVVETLPAPLEAILGYSWLKRHNACINLGHKQRKIDVDVLPNVDSKDLNT